METEAGGGQPKIQAALQNILIGLTQNGFITRAFLLAASDKQTSYRALQKGMAQGYVKEFSFAQKVSGRTFRSGYFGITERGLQYLMESDVEAAGVELFGKDFMRKRIAESGRSPSLQSDKLARYLSVSGTAFLASLMGYATNPLTPAAGSKRLKQDSKEYMDTVDEVNAIDSRFAAESMEGHSESAGNGRQSFWNAYEVKEILAGDSGQYSAFHAGRFTGILESNEKSVLVYVGAKGGMSWSKVATKPEFKAHHVYSAKYSKLKNLPGGENHGIMFVQNARLFANLYLDAAGKRKEDLFADRFNSFAIFPVDIHGVANALEYMEIESSDYERQFTEAAIQSGIYEANISGFASLFPLKNGNGVPMAIGVFIDAVKLNRLRSIYVKTNSAYGIICYPWQIDYYQRVIPEAVFMTIN